MLTRRKVLVVLGIIVAILITVYSGVFGIAMGPSLIQAAAPPLG